MSREESLAQAQSKVRSLTAELAQVRKELKAIHALHENRLAQIQAKHAAELELARGTSRAQVEIAGARAAAEVAVAKAQREDEELTRRTEYERLEALVNELSEEIDVLSTFSRERAAAFYEERVRRDQADVQRTEAQRKETKRALQQAKHHAQSSGLRTATDMAAIDAALALASAQFQEADLIYRDAAARLADSERKLAAARG
ncbi:MAG: hypothetical protein R3B13_01250 [Polyangiaceae bacterium]